MNNYLIQPQVIYLLERYTSAPYFKAMRDAFANMVAVAEQALDTFMQDLPYDYRNRPVNQQPDIVWGEHVLPNLRNTLAGLNRGYEALLAGDYDAIGYGNSVEGDFRAIRVDYSIEWMTEEFQEQFFKFMQQASYHASNLQITSLFGWYINKLAERYNEEARGPLNLPASLPVYRLNPDYTVKTGETVPVSGVYVPDREDASAQFLYEGMDGIEAYYGYDEDTFHAVGEVAVTWMLVERAADTGGTSTSVSSQRLRCEAGKPCPKAGMWWTPADTTKQQHFDVGDVMPNIDSSEWQTIWYLNETNEITE